ncbi:copper transporter [Saccharopolyspora taberi]|uniref:Copper transporter n=1 Tax=Saccharopolyspora taberi TaxID=60895 RepID=A0ABN3VBJ6_9PSEU
MISPRHHVISIAAVFLALALGVILGSTSVSERLLSGVQGDRDALRGQVDQLRVEQADLRGKLENADRFGNAIAPAAVRGQLTGKPVVLLAGPTTAPEQRDAVKQLLSSSGANITGELQLTEGFTGPDRADQLRRVVTELMPAGAQLPVSADPGTLAGGLVGPLVLQDPRTGQPQASDEERAAALTGLTTGGFVNVVQEVRPAQAVVILTGERAAGERAQDHAAMLARFAAQVDRSGAGAVLAGTADSAQDTGPVGFVRSDGAIASALSTVDNIDTAAGRVALVMAVREQLGQQAGHYGAVASAQSPLPSSRG